MTPPTGNDRSMCERALDLVERGWSQRRIAKHLGIGKTTVHDYVVGEYGNGAEVLAKREHNRGVELARVDRVIRRLDKILVQNTEDDTVVKAAAVLLKASERRCKMLGLDAPTKTQQVDPEPVDDAELLEQLTEARAKVEARIAEKAQLNGKGEVH